MNWFFNLIGLLYVGCIASCVVLFFVIMPHSWLVIVLCVNVSELTVGSEKEKADDPGV